MKLPVTLKGLGICLAATVVFTEAKAQVRDSTSLFTVDTVARTLGYPWEILYGPDDSLWVTEARGYRVLRISKNRTPAAKNVPPQQVLKIPLGGPEVGFTRGIGTWPQGGMQGMVLHPEFLTGKPWVYLSYVYSGSCAASPGSPCVFRTKVVRCRFYFAAEAGNPSIRNPKHDTLIILNTIIDNLPGSNDHNSGRLAISPIKEGIAPNDTYKLYYTIGDMGAGQFNNASRTNQAQARDTCEGKILRFNTEPDGTGTPATPVHDYDKFREWIPNDNPFFHSGAGFTTLKTPVYSYGHRNAQGVVWGNVGGTWRLYSSEHGDKSDDEVNVIQSGGNYGWPKVAGMADDNYNTTDANTNNDKLANTTVNWREIAWASANNMKRPLFDFFNADSLAVPSGGANIFTWPTIAPSGIDFYQGNIPGWRNSLLVTSLKYGVFRLKLNAAGTFVDSASSGNVVDTFPLMHGWRVRDIAINPVANSGQFWVAIDSTGSTSGPTGGFGGGNTATKDGGNIMRLTYKNVITLPVQFVGVDGKLTGNSIALNWTADVDEKHKWFEVEKSADGQRFVTIGYVPFDGHRFTDAAPFGGNNYYRIKAVSVAGGWLYSSIINVPYLPAALTLNVYPNPVADKAVVRLTGNLSANSRLLITDAAGRTVYQQNIAAQNNATVTINVSRLPAQLYVIKVVDANGTVLGRQKLVKE